MKEKIKNILIAWLMPELKAYIDNAVQSSSDLNLGLVDEMFSGATEHIHDLTEKVDDLEYEVENLKEKVDDLDYELDHVKDDVSDLENADNCDLEEALEEFEALKTKLERIKDIL